MSDNNMSIATKNNTKTFFKTEKVILRAFGISLYENESFGYNVYSFVIWYVICVPYPIIASADLFKHEFDVVAQIYIYVVGGTMALSIAAVVRANRNKLGKLITKLENPPFSSNRDRGGVTEEEMINSWHKMSNLVNITFLIGVILNIASQWVIAMIHRLTSEDYHDWKLPFGPLTVLNITYSPNYEITFLYQTIAMHCIGFNMSCSTVLVASLLAFVSVQFKMLQNNLRRILGNSHRLMLKENNISGQHPNEDETEEVDPSKIPWKHLKKSLVQVVTYHNAIIELAHEIEQVFSVLMMSVYLCILSLLCFDGYRATLITLTDPLMFSLAVETSAVCFQLLILCFSGELVATESEAVAKAVYETSFVGTDLRFQKGLAMILRRSQKPYRIKAGKLIDTSMVTFASILRSAYSAFMMLRRINQ